MKTLEDLVSGVKKGLKRLAYAGVVLGALAVGAGEAKAEFVRGNLFVASPSYEGILELDEFGNEIRSIDRRGISRLESLYYLPRNLTFGPDGNLYVLRRNNSLLGDHSIYIYNSEGDLLDKKSDFTGDPSLGLAFSPVNDHLYLTQGPGRIIELDENLNFLKVIADDIRAPYDLDIDSKGNIYVSDFYENSVRKYSMQGDLITTFGNFELPYGLAIGPDGNIFVCDLHDRNGTTVDVYDANTLEFIRQIGDEHIGGPSAYLTFDNDWNIYVTSNLGIAVYDFQGNHLRQIDVRRGNKIGIEIYIPEPFSLTSLLAGSLFGLRKRKK